MNDRKGYRVVFCGTPAIAVPALLALAEVTEIPAVVCQPDRPAGRGMKLQAPAVKIAAQRLSLPVYQPARVRDGSLSKWLEEQRADAALVMAYGRILNRETLQTPRLGCVNLHASLLPQYRGAAPIQRALMDGQEKTGICLMQMDEGMDTGPVLSRTQLEIEPQDNNGTLSEKLGRLAADVVRQQLLPFLRGELAATPQDHTLASYAPPLVKQDQQLNFLQPARRLENQVRGLAPRPAAVAQLRKLGAGEGTKRTKIHSCRVANPALRLSPGELGEDAGRLFVGTGEGILELLLVQPEGKKAQTGSDAINGRSLVHGDRFDLPPQPAG